MERANFLSTRVAFEVDEDQFMDDKAWYGA